MVRCNFTATRHRRRLSHQRDSLPLHFSSWLVRHILDIAGKTLVIYCILEWFLNFSDRGLVIVHCFLAATCYLWLIHCNYADTYKFSVANKLAHCHYALYHFYLLFCWNFLHEKNCIYSTYIEHCAIVKRKIQVRVNNTGKSMYNRFQKSLQLAITSAIYHHIYSSERFWLLYILTVEH